MIRTDPLPHLAAVAAAVARPGQPHETFAALDAALAAVLGHKLFTILAYHAESGESERCYTNQPAPYPVGGRKPLPPSTWVERVLGEHRAFLGRTAEDIRAVFTDHALIASLGCEAILNLPVVVDGRALGTINLLHQAHWYDEGDAEIGGVFAALAIPALLLATASGGTGRR
jgi:hypothetical protein